MWLIFVLIGFLSLLIGIRKTKSSVYYVAAVGGLVGTILSILILFGFLYNIGLGYFSIFSGSVLILYSGWNLAWDIQPKNIDSKSK